jgi:hypothetical protein
MVMVRCTRKGCGQVRKCPPVQSLALFIVPGIAGIRFRAERAGCMQFSSWCTGTSRYAQLSLECLLIASASLQVFHEGLKSWSCCQDTNKPVLDFDEFMKLPVSSLHLACPVAERTSTRDPQGCHEAAHTDEPPKTQAAAPKLAESSGNAPKMTMTSDGKESYTTAAVMPAAASAKAPAAAPAVATTAPVPAPPVEEEDDPSATVPAGTKCRHTGCSVVYESDAVHRAADGAAATCVYHPRAVSPSSKIIAIA